MTPHDERSQSRLRLLDLGALALTLAALAWLMFGLLERDDHLTIGPVGESVAASLVELDADGRLRSGAAAAAVVPLVEVRSTELVRGQSRAVFCVAVADAGAFDELTAGLELVWLGPGDTLLARQPLEDAMRAPRYGLDRRCAELPQVELAREVSAYRVVLSGEPDVVQRDQLGTVRHVTMVFDQAPIGLGERLAVVLLLVSMLLRLVVWQQRRPAEAGTVRWRGFDPLLGTLGALVLSAVVAGLLSGGRVGQLEQFATAPSIGEVAAGDAQLGQTARLTLMVLLANVGVYVLVASAMARWRSSSVRTALATVRSQHMGVVWPFVAGLALAVGATALLTFSSPDETSPMQWMTAVPGTLLATAAMACLSPWFEEIFFRGFIFGSVEGVAGRRWGAAVSLGLFVLAHVPQHQGFLLPLLPILAVATVATWLRYASGSVTPAFALHLGYNLLLVLPALFSA